MYDCVQYFNFMKRGIYGTQFVVEQYEFSKYYSAGAYYVRRGAKFIKCFNCSTVFVVVKADHVCPFCHSNNELKTFI